MKTWVHILFIFIIFSGLSSSCTSVAPESITPSPTVTRTPTPITPTATLTPTATSMPASQFDFSCWSIKPLQKGNDIKGSFVYAHFVSSQKPKVSGLVAWDISSFHSTILKSSYTAQMGGESYVSPNGEVIAALSDKNIILISRDGAKYFPLPNSNVFIKDYLKDGRILLVDVQNRKDSYKENVGLTDIYYIFNPLTGETTKNSIFLPDLDTGRNGYSFTIQYSSDMKYVLYRSKHAVKESKYYVDKFTLYDLIRNKAIWVGPLREANLINSPDTVLGWQPNTNNLTALYSYMDTDTQNYFSISLDGKISPLTNFDGLIFLGNITNPIPSEWSGWAESPNWSPNGRYLIFKGLQKEDKPSFGYGTFMYIWDNQEKIGYKPCLPDEREETSPTRTQWSFDGSYAIMNLTFGGAGQYAYGKSYLLDLGNKIIYEMPDDSQKGFESAYRDGYNALLGWVNWESP